MKATLLALITLASLAAGASQNVGNQGKVTCPQILKQQQRAAAQKDPVQVADAALGDANGGKTNNGSGASQ